MKTVCHVALYSAVTLLAFYNLPRFIQFAAVTFFQFTFFKTNKLI